MSVFYFVKNEVINIGIYGIVYCIENTINSHKYIGQTIRGLEERVSEHFKFSNYEYSQGRALYQAINKYGKENFISYELDKADNQEELDEKESYWISHYNTFLGKGYNMTAGGQVEKKDHENQDISDKLSETLGGREFLIFDMDGNFVKSMVSQTYLAKELDCAIQSINNCLLGIKSQVKGYVLIFKDEFSEERLNEIYERINRFYQPFMVQDGTTKEVIGIWKSKSQCAKDLEIGIRGIQKQLSKPNKNKIKRKTKYIFTYINQNKIMEGEMDNE